MEQRFEQANVTHDGHLTEAQAKAGYPTIARHFAAIDQDKKGYVTEDDIRAYNKLQRSPAPPVGHHSTAPAEQLGGGVGPHERRHSATSRMRRSPARLGGGVNPSVARR